MLTEYAYGVCSCQRARPEYPQGPPSLRRMLRRRAPLAVVLALALVAGACGDDDGGDDAATTTTAAVNTGDAGVGPNGFRPDPIAWEECGAAECALVEVPLDYAEPTGSTITLSVLRQPAAGRREGALFVNPGGPGGSAVQYASLLPLLLPESITDRFDVVGVEPRGLDGSAPLRCRLDEAEVYAVDPTVEDAADRTALVDGAAEVADACQAGAGELLAHIGTRDVARDIDAVRAAMGDPTLSYYGGSYGTAIGQVYADLFPDHLRAMVLDGIVQLGPTGVEQAAKQAAGFERTFLRFVDHCRTSGECTTDDPVAAIEEIVDAAEAPGGMAAPEAERRLGPGELYRGLSQALYSELLWPRFDEALSDALDGDGSGLVQLADEYLQDLDIDIYYGVNCVDFVWPVGDPDALLAAAKDANEDAPHFGEALVTDYLPCVDWPVPAEPLTAVTAPGSPPVLVISTTGDPATPHEGGIAVADRLEHGVLVVNEGDSHGALGMSSCVDSIVAAYLVDGVVPEDGVVCG